MGLFSTSTLNENPSSYATPAAFAPSTVQEAQRAATYDYVIIGGGTAGCVLASRLSEDANVSVLVLEAGGTNNVLETQAPLTFGKLFKTDKDWNYETVPQGTVANRELFWPRGKMIGGSSSMNAMMYHHCSYTDYDEWEKEFGCKGWGYKDMQPYFRKAEQYTPNVGRAQVDPVHRGSDGLWQVGHSHLSEIGGKGFVGGCIETGIPFNPDINTPRGTEGVTHIMTFIDKNGRRSSAATAYLPPAVQKRSNLTIGVKVMVTRVIFDRNSSSRPRAIAVELEKERGGQKYYVSARTKIVLSAGSINTPQTLMLSGVGPRATLERHGIPVVLDNPNVGQHLKDHFCTSTILCKAKPQYTLDFLGSQIGALPALARWLVTGGGPLTNNVGECAAFFRSTDEKLPGTHALTKPENKPAFHGSLGIGPDLEVIGCPLQYLDHGFKTAQHGDGVFSMVPIGLRPKSVGEISIRSADAWDKAVIDPRYWTDEGDNDRKVLLAGVRICLKIAHSDALKPYLEQMPVDNDPSSFYWPYCADPDQITDDQIWNWMTRDAFTLYHPVASARMGPSAAESVLDLDLDVHGIDGLAVCDASVFPEQIAGHPTAAVIAVAEKHAELLKRAAKANADALPATPRL
ncbi:uncharacterized protein PFL1_06634 [Pseudozyma flocculosa PF-1]|uniref:Related to gmc type oxidoreductase n=2 Tax=Pseudozyma flocculosa TaxID=84751 RepID=A0A5C3F8X9_9BASI|nr:uncharacterized protein PFL1_06634 [Pseudozyma flocculosa PF-1]EPQ25767.1 hypothetical protein PFL1_06634 [Pseudozyma flocculosa PF-1]SPO40536.1 related to gmc type oxidoreductase [Pseudozyma flocculosa]